MSTFVPDHGVSAWNLCPSFSVSEALSQEDPGETNLTPTSCSCRDKLHQLGGLKHHKSIVWQVWRSQVQNGSPGLALASQGLIFLEHKETLGGEPFLHLPSFQGPLSFWLVGSQLHLWGQQWPVVFGVVSMGSLFSPSHLLFWVF